MAELEANHLCGICKDLLFAPITFMCQHTFCRCCLEEFTRNNLANCPMCQKPFTIPPHNNELLVDFLRAKYPGEYHSKEEQAEEKKQQDETEIKMARKLRREIWLATAGWPGVNDEDEDDNEHRPFPGRMRGPVLLQPYQPGWRGFFRDFFTYNPYQVQNAGSTFLLAVMPAMMIGAFCRRYFFQN